MTEWEGPRCAVGDHPMFVLPGDDPDEPLICQSCKWKQEREKFAALGIVRHPEWRDNVPFCRKGTCPSWEEGNCKLDGRYVGYKGYNDSGDTTCWPEIRWLREEWLYYVNEANIGVSRRRR